VHDASGELLEEDEEEDNEREEEQRGNERGEGEAEEEKERHLQWCHFGELCLPGWPGSRSPELTFLECPKVSVNE
jgi:hypothetical protein